MVPDPNVSNRNGMTFYTHSYPSFQPGINLYTPTDAGNGSAVLHQRVSKLPPRHFVLRYISHVSNKPLTIVLL
jgi:hypothetical protein